MLRGDWVVPTFNSQLRSDKPVLTYWLMLASYSLLGVTEFAARLPSALLAVGTSLMVYHLGRRLFRPEVGLWAGLIMATNVWFGVVGRAATPDSTLIFCTTAALLAYVIGTARSASFNLQPPSFAAALPRSWWGFAAMYAAMGLAVLAKGPIGVAAPVAAIGLFVLFSRPAAIRIPRPEFATLVGKSRYLISVVWLRFKQCVADLPAATWAMRPLTLACVVLAIALPWYVLVGIRTDGQWLTGFFWRHNVERFMAPMEGHRGSIFYHPLMLFPCFFPWSLFLPAALIGLVQRIRRQEPDAASCRLIATWAGVWIGVFSLAGTKLPNYVLPAYPALAMMTGLWIADWVASPAKNVARRGIATVWWIMVLAGVGIGVGLWVAGPRLMPGAERFCWIGTILVAGAIANWWFQRRHAPGWSAASIVVSSAALLATIQLIAAPPISRQQNGPLVGEIVHRAGTESTRVGMFRLHAPGIVYYVNQEVEEVATSDGSRPDPDKVRWFLNTDRSLMGSHPQTNAYMRGYFAHNPVLVTDNEGYKLLQPMLPADVGVIDRQRHFGRKDEVIVIGRQPFSDTATAAASTGSTVK